MKALLAAGLLMATAGMSSASAFTGAAAVKAPENASVQRAFWHRDRGWHRGWYHHRRDWRDRRYDRRW